MKTQLYRHYNKSGILLYVGISSDAYNRMKQHSREDWFELVNHITIERFNSRAEAVSAETTAIHKERPIYNIHQNNGKFYGPITLCREIGGKLEYIKVEGGFTFADKQRQKYYMLKLAVEAVKNGTACPISSEGKRMRRLSKTPFRCIEGVQY